MRQNRQADPDKSMSPGQPRKRGLWFSRQSDAVKAALITAASAVLVGVLGAGGAVIAGVLQFQSPSAASGPATPIITPTVTVTVAEPLLSSPTGQGTIPANPTGNPGGAPRYLATMNPSGDAWAVGSWKMSGKEYAHSFGQADLCVDESITIDLGKSYRRLVTVVGVADTADSNDRDDGVEFSVYVDADDDDNADSSEQIVSRAAFYHRPAPIDITFPAARKLILAMNAPGNCLTRSFAVWGDPKVYP
ncbi:MAG TPA: NPCBM/NEW2 domain-containing protein [Streptosporangiaceae bacterium]|nr:NPCBM/NEW2 domain-containing protein [Streptosporangiaceae bacterium]